MKKRIIAFICIMCMCIGILPAAAENNQDKEAYNDTIVSDFFAKLGLVTEKDSAAAKGNEESITRGEFAVLAFRILNGTAVYENTNTFNDISESTETYTAANTLLQIGALNGVGNASFAPDKDINVYDAASILLRMMGYQDSVYGSNTEFVTDSCSRYDLLSRADLSGNPNAKRTIFNAVYKLLSKGVAEMTDALVSNSVFKGTYSQSDETLLSRYFDIYKTEDILISDGAADIMGEEAVHGRIKVGDMLIAADTSISVNAGTKVCAYYKNDDDPKLFAIYNDSKNEICTVVIDGGVTFDDYTYYYYVGTRSRKVRVNPENATFMYNNKVLTSSDMSYLLPDYGTITFTDNDGDGNYDVVSIKSYISFLVKSVTTDNSETIIRGRDNRTVYLNQNSIPCSIKGANDITAGAVVSCAVTEENGKTYAREIVVCTDRVDGTISAKQNGDNNTVSSVVIGGKTYDVYPLDTELSKRLGTGGETASFCLDFLGRIVDTDKASALGDVASGYVVKLFDFNNEKAYDTTAALKIYDELGRMYTYLCAKKVTVDSKAENGNLYALLSAKNIVNEVILFRVNEKGEINYIDTPVEYRDNIQTDDRDTLIKAASNGTESRGLYYSERNKSFAGRVNLTDNTIIFKIPQNTDTDDVTEYGIIRTSDLIDAVYYPVQGYTIDPESPFANVAVIKDTKKNLGSRNGLAVVVSVNEAVNEQNEPTYSLDVYDDSGEHSYAVKSKTLVDSAILESGTAAGTQPKISAGDLVRYSVNSANEIDQIVLIYDESANTIYSGLKFGNSYSYGFRTFTAVPYSAEDGYLKLSDPEQTDFGMLGINDYEYISADRFDKCLRVYKHKGKFAAEEIDPMDIKTYERDKNNYSTAVVNIKNQNRAFIVTYERSDS